MLALSIAGAARVEVMMDRSNQRLIKRSRELLGQLRELGDVNAPPALLSTVLGRLGLVDSYAPLETPIGRVFVAYNDHGVSAVMRTPSEAAFEREFRRRFGRPVRRMDELPARFMNVLHRQLYGRTPRLLRFDLRHLSAFERAVLLKILQIPRGEVRPYAWVAREIGHPRAVRAVGSALGRNPIPLFIPCHRVVRSDGSAGEYVFGRDLKRAVLAAEGVDAAGLESLSRSGVRYYGSDTTQVYCFPTCRNARRITERHRVSFSSAAEAAAEGYRPCMICRPAQAS
jgi:O-6-methylguanine DNA methyltransferase